MKRAFVLVAILPLAGCATSLSMRAAQLIMADENMVQECQFVGPVSGSSGFGNVAASVGMNNARNECLESAAKMGATHLVITAASGGYSPATQGRAYRCEDPSKKAVKSR